MLRTVVDPRCADVALAETQRAIECAWVEATTDETDLKTLDDAEAIPPAGEHVRTRVQHGLFGMLAESALTGPISNSRRVGQESPPNGAHLSPSVAHRTKPRLSGRPTSSGRP